MGKTLSSKGKEGGNDNRLLNENPSNDSHLEHKAEERPYCKDQRQGPGQRPFKPYTRGRRLRTTHRRALKPPVAPGVAPLSMILLISQRFDNGGVLRGKRPTGKAGEK